jgi:hypothetical protein
MFAASLGTLSVVTSGVTVQKNLSIGQSCELAEPPRNGLFTCDRIIPSTFLPLGTNRIPQFPGLGNNLEHLVRCVGISHATPE